MTDIIRRTSVNIPAAEIIRYLGYKGDRPDENVMRLIFACSEEINEIADYRACRERVPLAETEEGILLQDVLLPGKAIKRNLDGCRESLAFAATVGPAVDRRIAMLKYREPAKALIMDAAASAAVEAFCDEINDAWEKDALAEGKFLRPRFSPGYGDLPISVQKDLLRLLDAAHLAGITLTDSMMMIPRKSVSAVIGIADECTQREKSGCAACGKRDCTFRRNAAGGSEKTED
ncbi:MAG: Vitamin B12 dependent methionine synthase activation subunit [Lachnospiraceae bacterium]|nr:Vitamin B12 dependent methionine synthase activation subunit [Lachnospiraceae bacterium]